MAVEDILGAILGGASTAGGAFLTKEAMDRLSNIGREAQREAEAVAAQAMGQTRFKPFGITSATGGAFTAGPSGTSMTLSPQELAMQQMLMGQAGTAFGTDPYGQAMGRMAAESAYGLGQQFMGMAGQDTAGREADIYQRIRAMQSPEEQRQQMMLEERLANQGRLGVRTNMFGGTPEQLALSKAQSEAQNQAAYMAMQQAQQQQAQQAQLGQAYTGLGSQLAARDLASRAGQQQLGLGALGGAYVPQSQMLNVMQASELYPQLAQRGQLMGAQMYGEGMMTGIEAKLLQEQARADLLGDVGSALLGGGLFGGASGGGLLESIIGLVKGS